MGKTIHFKLFLTYSQHAREKKREKRINGPRLKTLEQFARRSMVRRAAVLATAVCFLLVGVLALASLLQETA